MARLVRAVRVSILLAVVVPALAFAIITKDRWDQATIEAERMVVQEAAVAAEHIGRVLETQESILQQIDLVIRGQSWVEIETSPAVTRMLKDFGDRREHVASVWIADEQGLIRTGSVPWRPGTSIADRDYFVAQREADQGTFIGEAIVGRASARRVFAVSRRRTTDDGSFGGTIHVAVAAEYIEAFYATLIGTDGVAILMRPDGAILARNPPTDATQRLGPASQLVQRLAIDRAANPTGAVAGVYWGRSVIDGVRRLYGYHSVEPYGLVASIGIDARGIYAQWRQDTLRYGVNAAVLVLLLVAAGFGLLSLARRADAATARALEEADRNIEAQRTIDALERQNAVSRVVAGVAHEFNNLLTPIMMGAELVRDRTTDEEQRRTLTSMIAGAERGARLVADLLSHIQNQFLRIEPVALRPVIDETLALFRAGRRPEVQVTLTAEQSVPEALADRRQFQLALTHLLDNADTALPEGGTIAVRLLGPEAGAERRYLSVVVQDNGTGMSPEVLAQAREPFFTTAAYRERPGLGLSMVSGFMRQIGGELVIETLPGWGTRAEMRLPIASD